MTILLNPRGSHGSGKSYVMRKFLAMHPKQRMIYGVLGARLPEAYEITVKGCAQPVYVIGPYITVCGGLDCIRPYESLQPLIDKYAARGHVVFEGLLASGVYGKLGEHLEKYKKRLHVLFLSTPLDVCIQRVKARRAERGTKAEFNDVNVRKKHRSVELVQMRMESDKVFTLLTVSSDQCAQKMTELLRGGVT